MEKKVKDKVNSISPDKEIDPDELVHEQELIPENDEEQDIDDLVHSIRKPEINAHDDEQDIDDLMHEGNDTEELTGPSSGQ